MCEVSKPKNIEPQSTPSSQRRQKRPMILCVLRALGGGNVFETVAGQVAEPSRPKSITAEYAELAVNKSHGDQP